MKRNRNNQSTQRGQRGIAMMEVLIAFFVLSIGLLGLAGLQIKALQFNQSAFQQSQATVAVYDILDRMRLNRLAVTSGAYDTGGFVSSHSSGTLADSDLNAWLAAISGNLPDGEGSVECDGSFVCVVSVRWTNRFNITNDPNSTHEIVTLSSQLSD